MICFYNLDKRLAKVEREEMEKYSYILLNKWLYVSRLLNNIIYCNIPIMLFNIKVG